jgi:spore maturation protein SpmB
VVLYLQQIIDMILESGARGIDLSLYLILPIMVTMMAIMKVLEEKNVLNKAALFFSPLLLIFGLPGLGVFALIQILFISFAAPVATLKVMEMKPSISDARIAATLAAILVMAQANASFPLVAVGLNLPINILTSIPAGLLASFIAFKMCEKMDLHHPEQEKILNPVGEQEEPEPKKKIIPLLFKGGEEGLQITLKSIPPLILAILMVNIFEMAGIIGVLETLMAPLLTRIGIPSIAVLPIVTKFIAGGTAMMAIILDLMENGLMTVPELNRMAGFTLNPLDPVGLAVLTATGPRVSKVVRPAIIAAVIGIIFRGIIHIIIF